MTSFASTHSQPIYLQLSIIPDERAALIIYAAHQRSIAGTAFCVTFHPNMLRTKGLSAFCPRLFYI